MDGLDSYDGGRLSNVTTAHTAGVIVVIALLVLFGTRIILEKGK